MQSDIDLYCPEHSILAAQAALRSLGYESNRTLEKFPADHLPEMTRKRGWRWRGNAYDPEMPPAIDVHFCFWNFAATRLAISGVDQFWGRRIVRHTGDLSYPALCPIDSLAFNALHILRDLQRGDWVIHHVYELACFLHTHAEDEALWQTWVARPRRSLRSLQAISFWLAREWFNCCCAVAVDREMARIPRPVPQMARQIFPSPLPACFTPISMVYGCTSACLSHVGINCSFWPMRCFLFGFRLWALPGRTHQIPQKANVLAFAALREVRITRCLPRRISSSNLSQHPLAWFLLVV